MFFHLTVIANISPNVWSVGSWKQSEKRTMKKSDGGQESQKLKALAAKLDDLDFGSQCPHGRKTELTLTNCPMIHAPWNVSGFLHRHTNI